MSNIYDSTLGCHNKVGKGVDYVHILSQDLNLENSLRWICISCVQKINIVHDHVLC